MASITEIEELALNLPEIERAVLAAHLLGSLPSVLHDEDEGIAEAWRRDAAFDTNPSIGMSWSSLTRRSRAAELADEFYAELRYFMTSCRRPWRGPSHFRFESATSAG